MPLNQHIYELITTAAMKMSHIPFSALHWKPGKRSGIVKRLYQRIAHRVRHKHIAEEISASGFFDKIWYLENNPDVASSSLDPLYHYIIYGAFEGRSPGPRFDAKWYLSQNPDVADARLAPLIHYLRYGVAEGRAPRPTSKDSAFNCMMFSHHSYPQIIGTAKRALESLAMLDPDLYTCDKLRQINSLLITDGRARGRLYDVLQKIFSNLPRPFDYLVFIPWLIHGGADLVAVNAINALVDSHGAANILLVLTDYDRIDALDWLPEPTPNVVTFSEFAPDLDTEERCKLVELLICALKPRTVLNVNSRACWDAFKRRGAALSTFTDLYAALFCRDYDIHGIPGGYADTHFRESLPFLRKVYFDNQTFIDEITSQYRIPASLRQRLVVLKQPISSKLRQHSLTTSRKRQLSVLWSGRLCAQKNIDLLMKIVTQSRDMTFDIWGGGSVHDEARLQEFASRCKNISIRGPFPCFDALPIHAFDVYLYTSLWDGIPNTLISVAAAGLPIVASDVGGIHELVTKDTGWLVANHKSPLAYVEALQDIRSRPDEARRRVELMQIRVNQMHSWNAYRAVLMQSPSFVEP